MERRYEAAGVGLFEDPWRAVAASAGAVRCAERLGAPALPVPRVPRDLPPLPRGTIAEHDAKRILGAAGIPVLDERLVTNAAEASAAAAAIGERLVLKIVSPDILHKTEMGGVMLNVPAAEAGAAYDPLVERGQTPGPRAPIHRGLFLPTGLWRGLANLG